MSKDPAFLFYPGDYLRDTQCLSESVQVAYDRIMCEHMRNICISHQQLKFFTKRFTDDEIAELKSVLSESDDGFRIDWVVESIVKRKAYSESRRNNRSKKEKHINNICDTYDEHMVIANENAIEVKISKEVTTVKKEKFNFEKSLIEYGFEKSLVSDWLKVRKTKKATNTETAFKKFIKQIELCKTDKNEILEICVSKSWSGFEKEYIEKELPLSSFTTNR